ncbi:hypothetical protein [uncultured Cohaesibacter sp.]|uniref:hypothetical protein n=1 Tax=uncultured Cohaesibacter sp. TaxID=1002546 RepID=UPI0029C7BAA5|nr:hypothetical protein [uncultured Cohaesibacter sp.]
MKALPGTLPAVPLPHTLSAPLFIRFTDASHNRAGRFALHATANNLIVALPGTSALFSTWLTGSPDFDKK